MATKKDPAPLVLSASRRTDMVRWYPGDLARALASRYPPQRVHSIVVVTKFPGAVLEPPVADLLSQYEQVVVQATITGLGGSTLEPQVPPPEAALATLSRLVEFTGHPERVVLRVDPILHWCRDGRVETNLDQFGDIASRAAASGVSLIKTSLVTPYPKAVRRLARAGFELVELAPDRRENALRRLEAEARANGMVLEFCCEPTRPPAACIDPVRLTRLHPRGLPARSDRPPGQRSTCACSHSVDLAWYSTHPCPSGCRYCYANPVISDRAPAAAR